MENKEILTLIERGFKPETISSEFNIPYAQIQEALLEKERNASKCETEMDKMRKKYFDYIRPSVTWFLRIDNLKINKIIEQCCK